MPLPEDFCIISGGQTGADRAALDFAILNKIPHGGWCPQGRLAEDGPIASIYKLEETVSNKYPQRTKLNVRDSDATLVLSIVTAPGGGTALTIRLAEQLGKPVLHLCRDDSISTGEDGKRLLEFIMQHDVKRLNVAGPRASQEPEIADYADAVLSAALSR